MPVTFGFLNVEKLRVSKEKRNGAIIFSATILLVDALYIVNFINGYMAAALFFAAIIILIYYRKPLVNYFKALKK